MKRCSQIMISGLLVGLLLFSISQTFLGNFASAGVGQAVFSPNCYMPPPNGPDTPNELSLAEDTCHYVCDLLTRRVLTGCYWTADATDDEYFSVLSTLADWYYPQIVFSKGHDTPWASGQLGLLDHDGVHVKDSDIFDYTDDGSFWYTFLWHCGTTQYYLPDSGPRVHGHPYCWTHNIDMDLNVYDDSKPTFIGWSWTSPQFEWYCQNGLYSAQYAHFVYVFWDSWSDPDDPATAFEALSDATQFCWGTDDWTNSILYCGWYVDEGWTGLQVWGHWGATLPNV